MDVSPKFLYISKHVDDRPFSNHGLSIYMSSFLQAVDAGFRMWEVGMNFYRGNDKLEVFQTASLSRAVSWNLITNKNCLFPAIFRRKLVIWGTIGGICLNLCDLFLMSKNCNVGFKQDETFLPTFSWRQSFKVNLPNWIRLVVTPMVFGRLKNLRILTAKAFLYCSWWHARASPRC